MEITPSHMLRNANDGALRSMVMKDLLEQLRAELPPVWHGPRTDEYTGGALTWGDLQNKHCIGEIPDEAFFYCGRKKMVRRDPLLDWWAAKLSMTIQDNIPKPSRRRKAA